MGAGFLVKCFQRKTRVAGSDRRESDVHKPMLLGANGDVYKNPSRWEHSVELQKPGLLGASGEFTKNPSCWEQSEEEMFLKNKVQP